MKKLFLIILFSTSIFAQTDLLLLMGDDAVSTELNTTPNATSDPYGNEANSIGDFVISGTTLGSSQTSVKTTGNYALLVEANTVPQGGGSASLTIPTVVGVTYSLKFDWRHVGVGGNWRMEAIGNLAAILITNTATTWESKDLTFTATLTESVFRVRELNVANDGGVYLDNLSITVAP